MQSVPFFGERLHEVRELRGFTIQQVADYLGVSKQAVSLYEKAKCKPSHDVFVKLTELLKVPSHFFSRPPLASHTSPIFYRSMASATKQTRDAAEQKLKWLRAIVAYLSTFVDIPPIAVPECKFPSDPTKISDATVEQAAVATRRHWGLGDGVISHVTHLLENKGVVVARFQLDSDKLDAFSIMEDATDRPYIVLASDKESPFRSRFDAAHELGHLVLHRNVPKQLLSDRVVFNTIENQANNFASAFLLPERSFGLERVSSNINSFLDLKKKWKASIASMIMRAAQLGMISDTQKTTLWIERSRRKWSKAEPFDNDYDAEQPKLIAESFRMIVSEKIVSKENVLADLAMDAADIESIAGIKGFFEELPIENMDPFPILKFPGRAS